MRLEPDTLVADQMILGSGESNITTERETPTDFEFVADQDQSVREKVRVRTTNPGSGSVTEDITVALESVFGTSTTVIASATKSVTVDAGASAVTDLLATPARLPPGTYRVTVALSGSTLTVEQASVHTRDIQFAWGLGSNGKARLRDHTGETRVEVPALSPGVRFPEGFVGQHGTHVAAFDGAGLSVDESGDAPTLETASVVDSQTVTVSGDGTTTVSLPHSLGMTPDAATVTPASADAMGDFYRSGLTDSAVELTYAAAPPSGTDNLAYDIIVGGTT